MIHVVCSRHRLGAALAERLWHRARSNIFGQLAAAAPTATGKWSDRQGAG